ncbi:hypothetical protein HGRIS_005493 [Hohenbuehelia grisea]|uniref:Enamelin n=1 Tax=Hohenbuehelia grisea TaxID=104357 RepID=A0ABR3JYF6_9AGAR
MGFFKNSSGFRINDGTFNDIGGNQNIDNKNTYDNRQNCGNTTNHNVRDSYNDYSVSDNSSGHLFQTNNGSGPFFAGPQTGYYAAPVRPQAQRARGRAPNPRAPNLGLGRGRNPGYAGGYHQEPAYDDGAYAGVPYHQDAYDGYAAKGGQGEWYDSEDTSVPAWSPPPSRQYPYTNPFAQSPPLRTQSNSPAQRAAPSQRPPFAQTATAPARGAGTGVGRTLGQAPNDHYRQPEGGRRGSVKPQEPVDEDMDEDEDEVPVDARRRRPDGNIPI